MTPVLRLSHATITRGPRRVLDAATLDLHTGERLALAGANGAGKTTLLHALVGLHPLQAGTLDVLGQTCHAERDFRTIRKRVGFLFQDSDDQLFCSTVLEDVMFGPLNQGLNEDEAQARAEEALALVGLQDFGQRDTHHLSGGEKRLAALATILSMRPDILLLDEPTNGLDDRHHARLTDILLALPQAMILVSHDRLFLERVATRAVALENGKLTPALFHTHPHVHPHAHLHLHAPGLPPDGHAHQHEPAPAQADGRHYRFKV
jgi:cobalt/nickel transport system ATP-binding protein